MNKKLVFLDIDGTLTAPGENSLSDSTREAIIKARENGHRLFLCTGRNYDMMRPLLIHDFDGFIASAGGYVKCDGEVIFDCPMTRKQGELLLSELKGHGIFRTVECLDGSYADEGFAEFVGDARGENSELIRWRKQIEESLNIRPIKAYNGEPIYKVVIMCRDKEQLDEVEKLFERDFKFVVHEDKYGIINGEIINRSFDKGQAVKRVCKHYKAKLDDTIGFGDSMNDADMFGVVGKAVCMKNGSETLLAMADMVCPAYDEDGIKKAFRELNLIDS